MQSITFICQATPATQEVKRRGRARKAIRQFGRAVLVLAAAEAAVRILMFGFDVFMARGGGAPGGEITLPLYIILIFAAGWKIHAWANPKTRKEKNRCTGTFVKGAEPALILGKYATASAAPKRSPKSVM